MKLAARIAEQKQISIFAESLALACIIGVIDWILPIQISLLVFYCVPIFFAAWFGGRNMAFLTAVLCTGIWGLANHNFEPFSMHAHIWAGFDRIVAFLVFAVGGTAMRSQRAAMQARLAALERSRELEEEILRVGEREQMRLGQDLHDGLCQQLAAIDCAVACLKHDLEERGLPEAGAANFIQEQLSSAIREARDMARGVFPVQIDEEGFLAALEELARTTNRLRQVAVTLDVRGEIKISDPQTGMHLYRIAQEALNNVAKHARATEVQIALSRTDHRLDMSIADNGIGFSPDRVSGRGLGMQTMRYRVKSMHGDLKITRGMEGGSVVRCSVPLQEAVSA